MSIIMIDNLNKFQDLGKEFEKYLRPSTFPIAIKLIKDTSEIPNGCKQPNIDLKLQNFICQNFKMARTYGWTIAITSDDCVCKVARTVYNWDPVNEETIEFGNKFSIGLYSKNMEIAQEWSKHLRFLPEEYIGIIISPLTRTKIIPDIVQIYCNPAQATRLVQSYLFIEGGIMEFSSSGRAGSCHEGVIKTFQTDKPQLVILGNGDRVWGGVEDDEVMFSIPKNKLEMIVEGLKSTHQGGLRYPIPKYMNYKPGFQNLFKSKAINRAGGTLVKDN